MHSTLTKQIALPNMLVGKHRQISVIVHFTGLCMGIFNLKEREAKDCSEGISCLSLWLPVHLIPCINGKVTWHFLSNMKLRRLRLRFFQHLHQEWIC